MAWTDERLDDLARRMDAGFVRLDRDLRDLRAEIGGLRVEMRQEIGGLRQEMGQEVGGLRQEIASLRGTMNRFGIGIMVALVGMIAAIVAGA
jgi:hypothetical protein